VFRVRSQRIGVYQPWVPSMDEGWTRLVLEKFHFPYTTLHNADIRAGDLKSRVDCVLIPSIDAKTLREGYRPDQTEPAYVGGLGQEGADVLREFVEDGGTLVCLEDSSKFAIEALGLPATNAVKDLPTSSFYGPGSIVRLSTRTGGTENPLTFGVPDDLSAYFDRSSPSSCQGARDKGRGDLRDDRRPPERLAARAGQDPGQGRGPRDLQGPRSRRPVRIPAAAPRPAPWHLSPSIQRVAPGGISMSP